MEKRGPGRPPTPPELKPVEVKIRMRPDAYDAAYRVAAVQGISPNALVQRAVERIFTDQIIVARAHACYHARQSTLAELVSGSRHETAVQTPTGFGGGVMRPPDDGMSRAVAVSTADGSAHPARGRVG